jgi:hypothetical protein
MQMVSLMDMSHGHGLIVLDLLMDKDIISRLVVKPSMATGHISKKL